MLIKFSAMLSKLSFLFLFTLLFSVQSTAQLRERMDSVLQANSDRYSGTFLFAVGDSIYYAGASGYADYANEVSMTTETLFDLASVSKQFTALAIIQLVEQGKLSYETTADEIIQGFPYPDVTIHHLLKHESGLPDYMTLMWKDKVWDRSKMADNDDVIAALIEHQPKRRFRPGKKHSYSNTGYLILASIVERVSGQSYGEYLAQRIFEPAGMTTATVHRPRYAPREIEGMSKGHLWDKESGQFILIDEHEDGSYAYPLDGVVGDGMVNASVFDLHRYYQALRDHKLISPESRERMFSTDEVSKKYGYGVSISESDTHRSVWHNGSWAGYYSYLGWDMTSDRLYIALTNNEGPMGIVYSAMREIIRQEMQP